MFNKVKDSVRLREENPSLIGKYVRAGRELNGWVTVTDFGDRYRIRVDELSTEVYTDGYNGEIMKK